MHIYIAKNGARTGPYTEAHVREMLTGGLASPEDLAWRDDVPEWQPLHTLLGLRLPPPIPAAVKSEAARHHVGIDSSVETIPNGWGTKLLFFVLRFLSPYGWIAIIVSHISTHKPGEADRKWTFLLEALLLIPVWGSIAAIRALKRGEQSATNSLRDSFWQRLLFVAVLMTLAWVFDNELEAATVLGAGFFSVVVALWGLIATNTKAFRAIYLRGGNQAPQEPQSTNHSSSLPQDDSFVRDSTEVAVSRGDPTSDADPVLVASGEPQSSSLDQNDEAKAGVKTPMRQGDGAEDTSAKKKSSGIGLITFVVLAMVIYFGTKYLVIFARKTTGASDHNRPATSAPTNSNSLAIPAALADFDAGRKKFFTKGHAKAAGLSITIEYPNSWQAEEAGQSHMVQKFVGETASAVLSITDPEDGGELESTFPKLFHVEGDEVLKVFTPAGATFVSGNRTKVDGLPAVIIEYTKGEIVSGAPLEATVFGYIFMCQSKLAALECMVLGGANSQAFRGARAKELLPLFNAMATSIVVEEAGPSTVVPPSILPDPSLDYTTVPFDRLKSMAEQGDPTAQRTLGRALAGGIGMALDRKEGIKWTRKAADSGDAEAQYDVGLIYAGGFEVEKSDLVAFSWMLKAAEQGHALAQSMVGLCYATDKGISMDHEKAVMWWRKAAAQGEPAAEVSLAQAYLAGKVVPKDETVGGQFMLDAARDGEPNAQYFAGTMYAFGVCGVAVDRSKAYELFSKAAENGAQEACVALVVCHYFGHGTRPNFVEAYKWALLAQDSPEKVSEVVNTWGLSGNWLSSVMSELKTKLKASETGAAMEAAREWRLKH